MNKTIKSYCIAVVLITVSILTFVITTQHSPSSTESNPNENNLNIHRNADNDKVLHDDVRAERQDQRLSSQKEANSNAREVIGTTIESHQRKPGWRIVDNCNNPRVGVHIVCTPISPELIKEWLSLEEKGTTPEPTYIETYTDSNGCFDFPSLESRRYLIRGNAPNSSPALGILDLRNEIPNDFKAIMVSEDIIRGVVLDCNQQPIKDATVYCYLAPTQQVENMPLHCAGEVILFKQHLLTDEKGTFSFGGLYPNQNYYLYADCEDRIPFMKLIPSNDNSDQVLILKRTCIVEGMITNLSGQPLPDAEVTYTEPQSPYSCTYIDVIDEEGHFRCNSIPEGFVHLQGMHKDYGHSLVEINARPDKVNYAELKLPKGIKVTVKVTSETGKPLEGIIITVDSQDTGTPIISCTTDKSGKAIINSLNIGDRNSIRTRDPKHNCSVYHKTHSFVENSDLQIQLKKRFPMKMIVKDEVTGEIISNYHACVSSYYKSSALREIDSLNTHTYEYEINTPSYDFVLAEGEFFEITVLADGYMPGHIMARLSPNEEIKPVEILLKPGLILRGCVVDSDTNEPISNSIIQLYINGRFNKRPAFALSKDRSTSTTDDGTFTLAGLPDNRFFLKIQASGFATFVIDSMELDLTAPPLENCIRLKRGGSVSGRILAQDNYPVEQAVVQVSLIGTNEHNAAKTDPNGYYYLQDLSQGVYLVSVWKMLDKGASDCTMKLQKTVEVKSGQTTTADFTFEGSCIIRGLCTVDGEEGCGIVINLFDDKGVKTHSVDASSTGFYKISNIAPGKYTLEAHSTVIGAGGMIRRPVTLQNGQDLTLDLDFKGKAVYGTVTDAEGQPIHAAEVELLTPSFQRDYLTYTDHEGSYAIFNVEEGNYLVVARAPSCGEERKGPWMLGGTQKSGRKVDFALKPGGAVRMHVNDSQGNPIPNAKVLLSNNMSQGVLWTEKTKYSGIAVFDNLQTESLTGLAIAKGYAAWGTTLLAPAGEITDAEITLTQGGSFKLTVKSKNGILISDAQVALMDFSVLGLPPIRLTQLGLLTPSNPGFLTDEKGVFSLGLLPPGNYKLHITKGSRVAQVPVSITSTQETGVQVALE